MKWQEIIINKSSLNMWSIFYKFYYTLWAFNLDLAKRRVQYLFDRVLFQIIASFLMLFLNLTIITSELLNISVPRLSNDNGKIQLYLALGLIVYPSYLILKHILIQKCGVSEETGRSAYYVYDPPKAVRIGVGISVFFIMIVLIIIVSFWANPITDFSQIKWSGSS